MSPRGFSQQGTPLPTAQQWLLWLFRCIAIHPHSCPIAQCRRSGSSLDDLCRTALFQINVEHCSDGMGLQLWRKMGAVEVLLTVSVAICADKAAQTGSCIFSQETLMWSEIQTLRSLSRLGSVTLAFRKQKPDSSDCLLYCIVFPENAYMLHL